jgi:hypothetical protein
LYDYATEQVDYITTANVTTQHDRWQIDGMLSTYRPVKDNIDALCQSTATFFTYDPKGGKFKVVPNRAATTGEKANAFVFNDDNIITSISVSSTELYSLYNRIEAEYPEVNKKDQTNIVIVDTPSGDRNPNEPDNPLNTRYDLVNDYPRVYNLANIDLNQSRISTVIEFDADYSAIQVDVGDVVKVNNTKYGYADKLFRVMRVTEKEQGDGTLTVNVILLEYSDDVYTHSVQQTQSEPGLSGLPGWYTGIWGNIDLSNIANIVNGNITLVDNPSSGNANVVNPVTGNVDATVPIGNANVIYGPIAPPGTPILNVPVLIPDIPNIERICLNLANLNVAGINQPGHFCHDHLPPNNAPTYTPGANITIPMPIPDPPVADYTNPNLPILEDFNFDLDLSFVGPYGVITSPVKVPQIPVTNTGSITSRGSGGAVQAGIQEEESQSNANIANAAITPDSELGGANSVIVPPVTINLGGIDYGEFSAINNIVPFGGTPSGGGELAYVSERVINYTEVDINPTTGKYTANANADIGESFQGSGILTNFTDAPPPSMSDNFNYEVSLDRAAAIASALGRPAPSATKTYVANTLTIAHYANSNLDNTFSRSATVTNADKRISRGDNYLRHLL